MSDARFAASLGECWTLTRRFPPATLDAIEGAVAASETRHRGEVPVRYRSCARLAGAVAGLTPRERALEVFAELGVWDTRRTTAC